MIETNKTREFNFLIVKILIEIISNFNALSNIKTAISYKV